MKKLLFTLLAIFIGIGQTVTAQTFTVIDKNGIKSSFDVGKLDSVTFQQNPPAFTIYENVEPSTPTDPTEPTTPDQEITTFLFEDVTSFNGDPNFLFTHPDTVYVDSEGEAFAFQLRTSAAYNYTISDRWLSFVTVIDDTDSLRFAATMNPSTAERIGYLYFANLDDTMRDTVVVVQIGKTDSRYIDIDWDNTTLNSFDEESGKAQLTFQGDVPVMGDYDVVLLPSNGDYSIRLIDNVKHSEDGKTVTLDTREGKMGNLFKNKKFTLTTETSAKSRGYSKTNGSVYTPVKVEIFTGNEYVEVFNADKATKNMRKAPVGFENEFISWEYNKDGMALWEKGNQSLSWDKLNFNIGLKGLFEFDFGDIPFEKVRMGDLQHLKIALQGGFDMEMVMKYLVTSSIELKKEWEIGKDVFKAKYTFMVGTVPVYISVGTDLMAEVSLGASGEASITAGIKSSNTVTYGIEWDAEKGVSKIAECEKSMEMVGPDVDIRAHAEARATVYPKIGIGIYKVLCPTISPQPYVKAEADARLVDNSKVAWNAGISTGLDLGLGLSLDLFFWEIDLGEIDPVNVFDLPLVNLPNEIHLFNEKEQAVLINGNKRVKYHVTHMNYLTGRYSAAKNVLVHFEAEGGEVDEEYAYTDEEGDVSTFFKLTDINGGKLKAEVMLGAEPENDEDAMKAEDWEAVAIDYRLTAEPSEQTIAKDAESTTISYKLEQYSSKYGGWWGLKDETVYFEATGGSCNTSATTNENGIATATFTPNEDFTEGSVTGSITIPEPSPWSAEQTAKIYAEEEPGGGDGPGGLISDEGLKKADELDDNTYKINDKVYDIAGEEDYAYWGKGSTGSGYNIDFCKEHPQYATVGWGGIFNITDDMVGKEIDYLAEKAAGNEQLYISLGTFVDPSAGLGTEGNMIEFNADELTEAKFLVTDNGDGTMSVLAHLKRPDGAEGWFKLKATKSPWGEQ